jgi:hypothetical protein
MGITEQSPDAVQYCDAEQHDVTPAHVLPWKQSKEITKCTCFSLIEVPCTLSGSRRLRRGSKENHNMW